MYCIANTLHSLQWITKEQCQEDSQAVRQARQIYQYLKDHEPEDVLKIGLHQFIDGLQKDLNSLDASIYDTFISTKIYEHLESPNKERCNQ